MKSVMTFAAMLLAANVAQASAEGVSEFHQHAAQGEIEVTPHFDYQMVTANDRTGGGKTKVNGFRLGVEGEYGIAGSMSAGVDVSYVNQTNKTEPATTDTDTTGLDDVDLFVRGSNAMGSGRLTYGTTLGLSLGDSETETNGDSNAQSGGMSLTPYVGYEMAAGPGLWGAQVRYNWLGERTSTSGGTETKTEGGSGFGVATFYEYDWSAENSIGASLAYDMSGETESGGTKNDDNSNMLTLSIYAPMKVADKMELIPRLDWSSLSFSEDTYGIKDASAINVGAALRWHM